MPDTKILIDKPLESDAMPIDFGDGIRPKVPDLQGNVSLFYLYKAVHDELPLVFYFIDPQRTLRHAALLFDRPMHIQVIAKRFTFDFTAVAMAEATHRIGPFRAMIDIALVLGGKLALCRDEGDIVLRYAFADRYYTAVVPPGQVKALLIV